MTKYLNDSWRLVDNECRYPKELIDEVSIESTPLDTGWGYAPSVFIPKLFNYKDDGFQPPPDKYMKPPVNVDNIVEKPNEVFYPTVGSHET